MLGVAARPLAQMSLLWPLGALLLLILLGLAACVTAPARPENLCAVFSQKSDWFEHAAAAEARWGAPIHVQMAIMRHESRFTHNALPPRNYMLGFIPWGRMSSAYGYAQATNGTWDLYRKATNQAGADRDEFGDAIDFIGWYLHRSRETVGLSLTDAYSHYLAYHEGQTGFRQGSYKRKPWLLRRANEVAGTAARYRKQLAGCRAELEDQGSWWWPF